MQNNLHELWALLNFLLPEIFSSAETFDEWFQISGENDQQEVVQQLHKVWMYPFLLMSLFCVVLVVVSSRLIAFTYLFRFFDHFFFEDLSQMLRKVCHLRRRPYLKLVCLRCKSNTTRLYCRRISKQLMLVENANVC